MKMTRRRLIEAGAGLTGGMLLASGPMAPLARALTPAASDSTLRTIVDAAVASRQVPGVALAVWQGGQEVNSYYAGQANLETATHVTAESVFRIGSLTKQFVAALLLKLESQGKLSLGEPAQRYLTFLPQHAPFSIRELLQHTAGISDGEYDTEGVSSQLTQAERIARMTPLFDFAPGTAWRYSNAGYILLGAIVEKVAELPLATAASKLLFEPLGLTHTAFDQPSDVVMARASGYTPTGTEAQPFNNAEYLDVALAGAAGAMRSTAQDLCRWITALFGGAYLPASSVQSMLVPARLRDGALAGTKRHDPQAQGMGDTQYGLGFMLDARTIDGRPVAGHHGGINGFAAYLACHPSSGLAYACLCNADTHPGLPLRDVRRQVLGPVLAK